MATEDPDIAFATQFWNEAIDRGDDPRQMTGWDGLAMLLNLPDGWTPEKEQTET